MHFEKFKDYPYVRPDLDAVLAKMAERKAMLQGAADAEEALTIMKAQHEDDGHFETMYQIAYIRNSVDTSDPFYQAEIDFFNESNPKHQLARSSFNEAVLSSPYLEDMKAVYGELYFYRLAQQKRLVSEANVADQIEDNRLIQHYFNVAGACTTVFDGKKVNFYGLLKYMESPDRAVRKAAMEAWSKLYASVADELDEIYSKMIEVRCRMAETLGLKDYTEMMYLSMERYSYDREDIARYRERIREYVVPMVAEIVQRRANGLGIRELHYYDEFLNDPRGNVAPEGSAEELTAIAQAMYRELSPETGDYFDAMCEHGMFDLVTGPTKQQGGYCTFVPDLQLPFIFSNFNGTTADVDVLTHEAGHGYEAYAAFRNQVPVEVLFSTSEVAEIHSMSMEFFTYPWMPGFFGGSSEKADRYRSNHLQDCLKCVPYMACVDEFQHEVYAQHMTSAQDRYALWSRLEKKYLPWRSYDGNAFLEKGGFWMQKQHIFMVPFYYIDYSLAQMGAFEFYLKDRVDHEAAWADYNRLCCAGGTVGYRELLKLAGLHNPFDDETLPWLMAQLKPLILP